MCIIPACCWEVGSPGILFQHVACSERTSASSDFVPISTGGSKLMNKLIGKLLVVKIRICISIQCWSNSALVNDYTLSVLGQLSSP